MGDDELLTPPELAQILKVPLSWVYGRTRRRRGDRLPHIRLGKYVRFLWGGPQLEEWTKRRIVSSSNRIVGRVLRKERT